MSYVAEEIASQPASWRQAAALASTAVVRDALPELGERVAVVGCGTSYFMAQSFASLREGLGLGETDAFAASEFSLTRKYDRVIAVTRSGTTTEILRLLEQLGSSRRSTVISTGASLPAASLASTSITLDFADERSVVQTRFATTALALWRGHLGQDLTAAIAEAEAAVATPLPADYARREQFTFLGTGWTIGLANEAALKLREASQSWAESYPAMEFRHGPISVIDQRSLVWVFGAAPAGLIDELSGTGCLIEHADIDPLAHLIRAQRLAVALAERRGLDPDAPRNLSRAVLLSPA